MTVNWKIFITQESFDWPVPPPFRYEILAEQLATFKKMRKIMHNLAGFLMHNFEY